MIDDLIIDVINGSFEASRHSLIIGPLIDSSTLTIYKSMIDVLIIDGAIIDSSVAQSSMASVSFRRPM